MRQSTLLLFACFIPFLALAQSIKKGNPLRPNGCNLVVSAGPDIVICEGEGKPLMGDINGSNYTFEWTPADGLSDPSILNPIANPSMDMKYTLTAMATSDNLIVNGDFESGGISPSTTTYNYVPTANDVATNSNNSYTIIDYPSIASQFGCETRGQNSMVIHGSTGTNAWCQTINVSPNREYKLSFWIMSVLNFFFTPVLEMRINGTVIGSIPSPGGICGWEEFTGTWNSGAATMATICIKNTVSGGLGNICALDDISMKECCVEKDEVMVTVYKLNATIKDPIEIGCNNKPITLDATGTSTGPGITYSWSTSNGNIVSGANTLKPTVDQPGTYKLLVTGQHGCTKEVEIEVKGNVTPPVLTLSKKDLECGKNYGIISVKSNIQNVNVEWSGPNGYFSNYNTDTVREEGEYEVTVTDDYGCITKAKIQVNDLRAELGLKIIGDTIKCNQDSALLKATHVLRKADVSWYYKGIKSSDTTSIVAKDTGWYVATVKDSAGCTGIDSFYVLNLKTGLPIQLKVDTINCIMLNVRIRMTGDTVGIITWTGPNNFSSSISQPIVNTSGWYYLTIENPNGCTGKDSIFVAQASDVPDVFVSNNDTLNCIKKQIQINGGTNTPGANIQWQGPTGLLGSNNMITVSDTGLYTLIVTGPNFCLASKSVYIIRDTTVPVASIRTDTINCIKQSVNIGFSTNSSLNKIEWTGPNNFMSNSTNPTVTESGLYQLRLIGLNGCINNYQLNVPIDTVSPTTDFVFDTLDCLQATEIIRLINDKNAYQYSWSGPNNFSSNQKEPSISMGGIYRLEMEGKNGCKTSYNLTVIEDKSVDQPVLSADTISCKSQAFVNVNSLRPGSTISWAGPNNFNSTLAKASVSAQGWYYVTVTSANGCKITDSIYVQQKDQLPDIYAQDDTLTCSNTLLTLRAGSNTPNVSFQWTGPNGFTSKDQNPTVKDSGIYVLTVTDLNGCTAVRQIVITKNGTFPNFSLVQKDSFITCKNNGLQLKASDLKDANLFFWKDLTGKTVYDSIILINMEGWYFFEASNIYGCVRKDSFYVKDLRSVISAQVISDTLNCLRTVVSPQVQTNEPNLNYQWIGPNGFNSNLMNPTIDQGGSYTLILTNQADCQLMIVFDIIQDTLHPTIQISGNDITCQSADANVKVTGSKPNLNYAWTGPNGFLSNSDQFTTKVIGNYFCTATDPMNGCSVTKTITITQDTNNIKNALISLNDTKCGSLDGKICICDIEGGADPLLFSIDGGKTFGPSSTYDNLPAGKYEIIIQDANGCEYKDQIEIKDILGIQINIENKIELLQGQTKQLFLQLNQDSSAIKTIQWTPADQLSCNDCLNPVITGNTDESITVTVIDTNGCIASATLKLLVSKYGDVYFPNVFSPNGDGINDYFYPKGGSDVAIDFLRIYDRWGELVFENNTIIINNEMDGWNGRYKEQALNPAVFTYVVSVKVAGVNKMISGEFTLLR